MTTDDTRRDRFMTGSLPNRRRAASVLVLGAGAFGVTGCVGAPTTRMGMVKNPETGLMIGSTVSASLVTDPSFYRNSRMKIRTRNTSGDAVFDLGGFENQIRDAFAGRGYEPVDDDDFGLLLDVNVMYSGHIQTNMSAQYGFLGAAAGGLAGARQSGTVTGVGIGTVSGATLGSIIGSYVTDDTYIIVTRTTFGVTNRNSSGRGKTITLSGSESYKSGADADDEPSGLKRTAPVDIAVYAGGRSTPQSAIASQVRERVVRIVSNII
jgi:hypothetical protein